MSTSIAIPKAYMKAAKPMASSSGSSYSSSPPSSTASSPPRGSLLHSRRPSLLSSAISKQESTVINIGDPDGPPRLVSIQAGGKRRHTNLNSQITYLSSSQGFAWNPEIFLPSYVDCDYVPLENRRDPVHDILLTDEELQQMLPQ
ncbi:hypothetical protein ACO1O0_007507 [Amphichorda felina]